MRLLNRIMIYYVLISLAIFSLGGYAFYYSFRKEVYEELDEKMRDEKKNIERQLASSDSISPFIAGINFLVYIEPFNGTIDKKHIERKDTVIYHQYEGEIPFRQWRFYAKGVEQKYQVTIRNSLIDIEDLSEELMTFLFYGFLSFIIASLAVNYLALKKVFHPFNDALDKLRNYGLKDSAIMKFPTTHTREFNELNQVLNNMSKRIHDDYLNIKEYTENASHEIQTPLAIISSKIELLMQNEKLEESQAALLESAYEATNRLYRLNQSLIMLSRIENGEFQNVSEVDLSETTIILTEYLREQFEWRNISVFFSVIHPFKVFIHPTLAEILLQNMLSNVMRYTPENGTVRIESDENFLQISNSGTPLPFPPDKIFQRFVKSGSNSRSLGIGLSLVKKIAEIFSIQIEYHYSSEDSFHVFTFKK